jgi:hypothetical protein
MRDAPNTRQVCLSITFYDLHAHPKATLEGGACLEEAHLVVDGIPAACGRESNSSGRLINPPELSSWRLPFLMMRPGCTVMIYDAPA